MPTVSLSPATYAKLQKAAKPFVDTEDSTCSRILDFYFEHRRNAEKNGASGVDANGSSNAPAGVVRLKPNSGKLKHTKLNSATVDGLALQRPKWNSLMFDMHVMARKRLGSFEAVCKASHANLRQGRYEEDGYRYLPEADLSVQGVDANLACGHSFRLATVLNVPLRVTFEWRDKDGAAYPRQQGVIEWTPNDR
jgi:hypothetical protein